MAIIGAKMFKIVLQEARAKGAPEEAGHSAYEFFAPLEPVDIQDSLGLANLIQAPFWMGALNVGGSPVSTGRSMGTDGFALAG
jgi:hypothetical protein